MGPRRRTVAIMLSAIVAAGACAATPTSPGTPSPTAIAGSPLPTAPTPGPTGSGTPAPSPSASPPPPPETSEGLIAAALAAGEIDYETSLLYRAYALVGDPRLPEDYASEVVDLEAGVDLFVGVAARGDRLSAATRTALAPFLARPTDPTSIFNQPRTATLPDLGARAGTPSRSLNAPRAPRGDGAPTAQQSAAWISALAGGGVFHLWARSEDWTMADLNEAARAVDEIWNVLKGLIGAPLHDAVGDPSLEINPDGAVDIYLLSARAIDPRDEQCIRAPDTEGCVILGAAGWASPTKPFVGSGASGYVIFASASEASWSSQMFDLAYLIFVVSTFGYAYQEGGWLRESTATWGAFRVLQALGGDLARVHGLALEFFSALHLPLYLRGHDGYVFWLFAQQEKDDQIVDAVWWAAQSMTGTEAVDAVLPFAEYFQKFALRNWNQDPVTPRYRDVDPDFPFEAGPVSPAYRNVSLSRDRKERLGGHLPPLTSSYQEIFVPSGAGIHQVKIDLRRLADDHNARVSAIVTIEGEETRPPEDWTGETEKRYCLDDKDERLMMLVLIVSKVAVSGLSDEVEIDPTQPCTEIEGTITYSFERREEGVEFSASASVSFELQQFPRSGPDYDVSSGSISWSVSGKVWYPTCTWSMDSGGGTFPLDTGPGFQGVSLELGMGPEGPDPDSYTLTVSMPVPAPGYAEEDPDYNYETRYTDCAAPQPYSEWTPFEFPRLQVGAWVLYGTLPEDGGALTGQETVEEGAERESISWSITRREPPGP